MKYRKFGHSNILIATLAALLIGCTSTSVSDSRKNSKAIKSEKLLRYEEKMKKRGQSVKRKDETKTSPQISRAEKIKSMRIKKEQQREAALKKARQREMLRDRCFENFDNVVSLIIDLKAQSKKTNIMPPYSYFTGYRKEDCRKPSIAKQMLKQTRYLKQRHSNKVGVIAPTIGTTAFIGKEIIAGSRSACQDTNCSFDEKIITRNSDRSLAVIKKNVADLLFDFNVSVLIGGTNKEEAEFLKVISERLEIPVFLLNADEEEERTPNTFKISPSSSFMANALIDGIKSNGIRKIAILRPNSYSNQLVSNLMYQAKKNNIEVTDEVKYTPQNFDSMKHAASTLLKITGTNRSNELRALANEKRIEAEEAGFEFNPEMVTLPPIKSFDAVFIPDNFKVVRHFVKLFKFHGIEQITLIGNHLWRSPEILEPWDPLLEGSIFADFVGNYKNLPNSLGIRIGGKGMFVNPEKMASIDFRLLGYRATSIALQMDRFPDQRRNKFSNQYQDLYYKDLYFNDSVVFTKEKHATWPTYLFNISKGNLNLSNQNL